MHFTADITIFLIAALIAVPLFRRLGFGAILGYLAAGVVIGPQVLGSISDVPVVMQVAEIGVVLLLFVIGLELKPHRLWTLRKAIFGTGTLQMALATTAISLFGLLMYDHPLGRALFIGLVLALSSTAFVLQTLAEQGNLATSYGRSAFGVLLFQDLAVIPILAILPVLGGLEITTDAATGWAFARAIGAIVLLILGGRYLLRPVLRAVAHWGSDETFTVAALLVVIGAAVAMEAADLSAGLGAFIAGVLLADSEYRHELEANINPFKGLLLGLFFISVGMSADLNLFSEQPLTILLAACGLIAIKFATLALGARFIVGLPWRVTLPMALILGQGGEFAFVLFHAASEYQILPPDLSNLLTAVVITSMALTPFLFFFANRVARKLEPEELRPYDAIDTGESPVLIAGFGRMGQIIARVLHMRHVPFTALERDAAHVDLVRRWGNKVYFGEPASLETLRAAGAKDAKLLIIALDNFDAARRIVQLSKRYFPHLKLYARARDRHQALHLMELGVDYVMRETWHSSLKMSEAILQELGDTPESAQYAIDVFRRADEKLLEQQREHRSDIEHLIQSSQAVRRELHSLFERAPRMPHNQDAGSPASAEAANDSSGDSSSTREPSPRNSQ